MRTFFQQNWKESNYDIPLVLIRTDNWTFDGKEADSFDPTLILLTIP